MRFFSKFQVQLNAELFKDSNDIKNSFLSKMSVNGSFIVDGSTGTRNGKLIRTDWKLSLRRVESKFEKLSNCLARFCFFFYLISAVSSVKKKTDSVKLKLILKEN